MTGVPRQEMPTLNVGKANAIRTSSCGVHGNVGYAGANLTHTPAAMGPQAEVRNVCLPLEYCAIDREFTQLGSYVAASADKNALGGAGDDAGIIGACCKP